MEYSSSMKSPPPSHSHDTTNNKQRKISNRITSSIKDKTCPICLTHIAGHRPALISPCLHAYCLTCLLRWSNYKRTCPLCNSPFDSYFSTSSLLSSRTFQKHRLLPLHPRRRESVREIQSQSQSAMAVQRVLRRRREEMNAANRRSRPVPRYRSFGQIGIYKVGLQDVPFTNRNPPNLNMTLNVGDRERILHRIEPWIRRELQAILEDPDPTVIVHVTTSLYLNSIEKSGVSSKFPDTEDTCLAPLPSFLHERTDTLA